MKDFFATMLASILNEAFILDLVAGIMLLAFVFWLAN